MPRISHFYGVDIYISDSSAALMEMRIMPLVRICHVEPLTGLRLRLSLTDGRVVERDVGPLFVGPVFEPIRNDPLLFAQVRVEHGTVGWPGDVDLDPDVLIWGGPPPKAYGAA